MDKRNSIELNKLIESVRYIDFFEAKKNDDYSLTNLTIEEYATVLIEFNNATNIKHNPMQKQLDSLRLEMIILNNCLMIFPTLGVDDDNLKIIKNIGVKIDADVKKLLKNIENTIKQKTSKYNLLSGELPDLSFMQKVTGYDMIAQLSTLIEIKLGFDISLAEYIAYYKVGRKKAESLKKLQDGRKGNSKRS